MLGCLGWWMRQIGVPSVENVTKLEVGGVLAAVQVVEARKARCMVSEVGKVGCALQLHRTLCRPSAPRQDLIAASRPTLYHTGSIVAMRVTSVLSTLAKAVQLVTWHTSAWSWEHAAWGRLWCCRGRNGWRCHRLWWCRSCQAQQSLVVWRS